MRKYIYLLIILFFGLLSYRSATRDDGQEVLRAQAVPSVQWLDDCPANWGYDDQSALPIQLYEPSMIEAEGVMPQLMSKVPKINFNGCFPSEVDTKRTLSIFNFLTVRIRGSDISYLLTSANMTLLSPKQSLLKGREPTYLLYARGTSYG